MTIWVPRSDRANATRADATSSSIISWNVPSNSTVSSRANVVSALRSWSAPESMTCTAKSSAPVRDAILAARRNNASSVSISNYGDGLAAP